MFDMHTPAIRFTAIEHNRGRRLKLQVNRKGEVIVKVPAHTPQLVINRFINQNIEWITTQQTAVLNAKVPPENEVLLFGKKYQVTVTYDKERRTGCRLVDDTIIINSLSPDVSLQNAKVQSTLSRFLRTTASHYILTRAPQWALKMDIQYHKIQLRQQRSRWGSCSSTGTLNFNWRLVHAPPAVVDYVIIHELAHRTEMNHSARFWQLVAKYDPAYQQHRGWLKREGRWVMPDSSEAD